MFGAGNFGVLVGSLVFSMLADKIGRRPILIGATLFFARHDDRHRAAPRRSASCCRSASSRGIGLGCIIPNATALVGEYSPRRLRGPLMMIIGGVGFTAGAAIGGFIAAWLIPRFGWRSVFYFGGAVPLVIALAMLAVAARVAAVSRAPAEGPRRRSRGGSSGSIRACRPVRDVEFVVREESREGVPVMHLFREGRGAVTILLWVVNFMNLLNLYFLASWLPTVVRDARAFDLDRGARGHDPAGRRHDRDRRARLADRPPGLHSGADRLVRPGMRQRSR